MSSKSSSSSRQSSPRAMPMETIITRFKSAQQRRQLREIDRSMTKVTEILNNPLKRKIKKKVPHKIVQKSNDAILITKDNIEEKKEVKNINAKIVEKVDLVDEICPLKLKRHTVHNKIRLKPKHEMKVIAQTNKRKRCIPIKGLIPQKNFETLADCACDIMSRDGSPTAKKVKPITDDMTMVEMIQSIEDSGSLNDEDLLEILTCPSPVWWEDAPDGYVEDALFARPRSTAEVYPSVRSQLHENLKERKRSNTPNVLSRRKRINDKQVVNAVEIDTKDHGSVSNSNNTDVEASIKCDERFIEKRNKLESVLGNLKSKNFKTNGAAEEKKMSVEKPNITNNSNSACNKVSVIKNLCANKTTQDNENLVNDPKKIVLNTDSDPKPSVFAETDSVTTDEEHLTDISFHDDIYLNDFENMDIPMQQNEDLQKMQSVSEMINERVSLLSVINNDCIDKVPDFKEQLQNQNSITNNCNKNKVVNLKESLIDPTYCNRKSSIMEDFLEMNLFEEDDSIVNKKRNEYSKSELNVIQTTSLNCAGDYKHNIDTNLTSVIKFQNSFTSSNSILKIENIVPMTLPPLKNSDKRKDIAGTVPENLPPLRRNPGVIHVNLESPKSNKSATSFDAFESNTSVIIHDNMDSISDTNVDFLNEDEEYYGVEKNYLYDSQFEGTSVIKSINIIDTNESCTLNSNSTCIDEFPKYKYNENKKFLITSMHIDPDDLCKKTSQANNVDNELNLDFQSLTITKLNDSSCCNLQQSELDSVVTKRNDVNSINCDEVIYSEEQCKNKSSTTTIAPESNDHTVLNKSVDNMAAIDKNEAECITVYKIISTNLGNEVHKSVFVDNTTNPKLDKNLDCVSNPKESHFECKRDDSIVKPDSNRDKMVFYFKKWKNSYWKDKDSNKCGEKKVEQNELYGNKNELGKVRRNSETDDNNASVKSSKVINTGTTDRKNKGVQSSKIKKKDIKNFNIGLTDSDAKKQKCIIVSGSKQIRYCMKCSSIFDTPQCNYCYSKNGKSNEKYATDYILRMEQSFVCDVCRYKALSKESLERHILSHCSDSKKR